MSNIDSSALAIPLLVWLFSGAISLVGYLVWLEFSQLRSRLRVRKRLAEVRRLQLNSLGFAGLCVGVLGTGRHRAAWETSQSRTVQPGIMTQREATLRGLTVSLLRTRGSRFHNCQGLQRRRYYRRNR